MPRRKEAKPAGAAEKRPLRDMFVCAMCGTTHARAHTAHGELCHSCSTSHDLVEDTPEDADPD